MQECVKAVTSTPTVWIEAFWCSDCGWLRCLVSRRWMSQASAAIRCEWCCLRVYKAALTAVWHKSAACLFVTATNHRPKHVCVCFCGNGYSERSTLLQTQQRHNRMNGYNALGPFHNHTCGLSWPQVWSFFLTFFYIRNQERVFLQCGETVQLCNPDLKTVVMLWKTTFWAVAPCIPYDFPPVNLWNSLVLEHLAYFQSTLLMLHIEQNRRNIPFSFKLFWSVLFRFHRLSHLLESALSKVTLRKRSHLLVWDFPQSTFGNKLSVIFFSLILIGF